MTDLTPEELKECIEDRVFQYVKSSQNFSDRVWLNLSLRKLGVDNDTILEIFDSLGASKDIFHGNRR